MPRQKSTECGACGLPLAKKESHRNTLECIEALRVRVREVEKRVANLEKPVTVTVSSSPLEHNPRAAAVRVRDLLTAPKTDG